MSYLVLSPDVSLRRLEEPYLYHRRTDELYELSQEAWDYLAPAATGRPLVAERAEPEFVDYLLQEGLAALVDAPVAGAHTRLRSGAQDGPSLRYLELYVTERCNLTCRHCFLGKASKVDLPLPVIDSLLTEFDAMGGLRLLLTGGETLLHPGFWDLDELLPDYGFRTVLLSNGLLLEEAAARLHVLEVQISLDGLEAAHDAQRGNGTFRRAMTGLHAAASAGLDVSVATMVTALDRADLPALEELVRGLGVRAWNVDAPTPCGALLDHPELVLPPWEAGPLLEYGFGGGQHESAPGAVCGSHLMAVFADGSAAKCGFYRHEPVGGVDEGLGTLWRRVPRPGLASLGCRCDYVQTCRGGCRFRASIYNGEHQPDPVQCHRLGVLKESTGKGGGE